MIAIACRIGLEIIVESIRIAVGCGRTCENDWNFAISESRGNAKLVAVGQTVAVAVDKGRVAAVDQHFHAIHHAIAVGVRVVGIGEMDIDFGIVGKPVTV